MGRSRVELVRWPAEAVRRAELAAQGRPRLLLVEPGVAPPPVDRDEDWIRLPADERDVSARLRRLDVLDEQRRRRPRLAGDDVLVCGDLRVVLAPGDAPLLGPLVERFGELVLWDQLAAVVGPAGASPEPGSAPTGPAPTGPALRARVRRLRSRLGPAGLVVHAVRGRGVLLDHAPPPGETDEA
jgi:hypothetical protein